MKFQCVNVSVTPTTATVHAIASRVIPHAGWSASSTIGVYEPAMSTKIMAWSARCIRARIAGRHRPRWYAADVPNSNATDAAYNEAATYDDACVDTTISTAPAGRLNQKVHWCNRPRNRGFGGIVADGSTGATAVGIGPSYGFAIPPTWVARTGSSQVRLGIGAHLRPVMGGWSGDGHA